MIDVGVRVGRARTIAVASVAGTLLFFAPLYGWWTLVLFAASALNTQTVDWRMARSARPERHVAFSIFWSQLLLAAVIALTGGPASPGIPWLVVPTAFAATRFRGEVVAVAVVSAVALLLGATLAVDPAGTIAHPEHLLEAIALLLSITAIVAALSDAEIEQRSESVLDPLTGLLNRSALTRRFKELEEQASLTGGAVSLLVCDVDRFKSVNDSYGHERGDAVLRDVAYEMRKQLRSFELIYRFGGEEFVLILPGAPEHDARVLAERLREALGRCQPGGLDITASIGVATANGADVQFSQLFGKADRALYAAKSRGRDRVVCFSDVDGDGLDELTLDASALATEVASRPQ